ncbi:MAG: cupin domain-containing protein [Chitinophagaceae bacterium]
MKKKNGNHVLLTLAILVTLVACNSADKKEEPTATTDTTKTEAVQPIVEDVTPDAIKAAPDLYKVLNDTMGIRIVEATYKPGDSSALHSHPDYAIYAVSGGMATFYGKDGAKMESEMKTGMTNIRAGEIHAVKNTGKTTIKVILVEVNRKGQTTAQDAATDATKVAPGLYKLKNDTLGIRVIDINYKPGQSSAMHSHGDQALYVIEPGKGEFTAKDGSKMVLEFKKGMTMVVPGGPHTVKNIGNTTLKAILVEVNRAM